MAFVVEHKVRQNKQNKGKAQKIHKTQKHITQYTILYGYSVGNIHSKNNEIHKIKQLIFGNIAFCTKVL